MNLVRPDLGFAAIWLLVLAAYVPFPTLLTPPLGVGVTAMVVFNIAAAPVIYYAVRWRLMLRFPGRKEVRLPSLRRDYIPILTDFIYLLMAIWSAIFLSGVIYSGGVPLIWYLRGDGRQYLDFGIRSISGFGDMLQYFAATLCVLLYCLTRRKFFGLLWLVHLVPTILHVSRGAFFLFLLQSFCMVFLVQKLRYRHLLLIALVLAISAGVWVGLGQLRGIRMSASDYSEVDQYFGDLPVGLYWAWVYFVTPLGNVAYGVSLHNDPHYFPYFTLAATLPTFLRVALFPAAGYNPVPLIVESDNAVSMYAPLVADFGLAGAVLCMTVFQVVATYAYVRARYGDLFYLLLYPSLYTALILSFFHIFILTPQFLAVPFVCMWLRRFMERRKSRQAPILAAAGQIAMPIP